MATEQFPVLLTDRLRLRKPKASDIPRIMEYANNPKVEEMTLNFSYPYREQDAVWWLNRANRGFEDRSHYIFAICLQESGQFIGGIGLDIHATYNRAEMGFWIGEPFWNQGYMTEAIQRTLSFGFNEIHLNKIYAIHFLKNPASGKVMEKNGMIKEGELKEHIRKGEEYLSVIQYRLTRKEFAEISD